MELIKVSIISMILLASILSVQTSELNPNISWSRPGDLTSSFLATNKKPVMMVIRKSWCAPCSNLREEFGDPEKSKNIVRLSQEFVMVDAADANEPADESYGPDGKYIPRIVFLDSNGKVRTEYKCRLNAKPNYQYYYSTAAQVEHSMLAVWEDLLSANVSTSAV